MTYLTEHQWIWQGGRWIFYRPAVLRRGHEKDRGQQAQLVPQVFNLVFLRITWHQIYIYTGVQWLTLFFWHEMNNWILMLAKTFNNCCTYIKRVSLQNIMGKIKGNFSYQLWMLFDTHVCVFGESNNQHSHPSLRNRQKYKLKYGFDTSPKRGFWDVSGNRVYKKEGRPQKYLTI